MATFTRNAWETGDTITADGLNGGKGGRCVIEIAEADFDPAPTFEIEIATGLTAADLIDMIVITHVPGSVELGISANVTTDLLTGITDYSDYMVLMTDSLTVYYYPDTGILTTSEPESGGGDDVG